MSDIDSSTWAGDEKENNNRLRALIETGAKIAGGAVGGALGFVAGGPGAAIVLGAAGAMASETLSHVGRDIANRVLGPREAVRVGGVIALTAERIRERIEAGDQVRSDGFFSGGAQGRSSADELTESILLKAQREAEEKKLPYMANLLANIAFSPHVGIALAQQLSKTAEALTYRQFSILGTIPRLLKEKVRQGDYRSQPQFPLPLMELLYDLADLHQRGLIAVEGTALLGMTDIDPSKLQLQGLGAHLHDLMGLAHIPRAEMEMIGQLLK